jgi:hypothetical protein
MKKAQFQYIILVAGFLYDDVCSSFIWLFGHISVAGFIIPVTSVMLVSYIFLLGLSKARDGQLSSLQSNKRGVFAERGSPLLKYTSEIALWWYPSGGKLFEAAVDSRTTAP